MEEITEERAKSAVRPLEACLMLIMCIDITHGLDGLLGAFTCVTEAF